MSSLVISMRFEGMFIFIPGTGRREKGTLWWGKVLIKLKSMITTL